MRPEFRSEYSKIIRAERARIKQEYESAPSDERPADPPHPNYNELQWVARQNVIQRYIDRINQITGRADSLRRSTIIRHFNERLLLPLPLVQDLTPDQYARLVEQLHPLKSPVKVHTDTARHYPYRDLAAHVLGYVQSKMPDPDEIPNDGIKTFTFKKKVGKTGLERSFDEQLSGTTGMEIWRVDPLGFRTRA